MSDPGLQNRRIVVVEDEFFLADELAAGLVGAGAVVLGPVGTIEDALSLLVAEANIDGAILDINLHGEMVFKVADALAERRVPFIFTTGYDASVIPTRFDHVTRCEKPTAMSKVLAAIGEAMAA